MRSYVACHVFGVVTLGIAALLAICYAEESLDAYIPASHKTIFEDYNVVVFGDMSVAKAAIAGRLAVMGKAQMENFDIAASKKCDKDSRSITVAKSLTARMGSINNGYTVVGRGTKIHHSVQMSCTNRVEQYDPRRNGDIEMIELRSNCIREAGELCATGPTGTVESANGTMKFIPGEGGYSCYSYFRVTTEELRLVNRWEYAGEDFNQNVVIVVSGKKYDFQDFRMEGFNSRRTIMIFCAIYGNFGLYNTRLHGAILAPTATFTAMDSIVNGSMIVGNLRGSFATLNVPYVTC